MKFAWREFECGWFSVSWLWKHAGLLTITYGSWSLHFGLCPRNWFFWFGNDGHYDGVPFGYFGLGPILLFYQWPGRFNG